MFKSGTVPSLASNAVLVIYASKGCHFCGCINQSGTSKNFEKIYRNERSAFCRISYDRTTLESCYGKYLALKLQLCASLASLNRKK